MTEVLMFEPKNLWQRILPAGSPDIAKLKESGWVQNPRLVAMYCPEYQKHIMVMIQDQKFWEERGYFAEPTMIYHPTDGTKMVSSADSKRAIRNGWYLSPAHFPGNSEGAIKTPNVMKEAS